MIYKFFNFKDIFNRENSTHNLIYKCIYIVKNDIKYFSYFCNGDYEIEDVSHFINSIKNNIETESKFNDNFLFENNTVSIFNQTDDDIILTIEESIDFLENLIIFLTIDEKTEFLKIDNYKKEFVNPKYLLITGEILNGLTFEIGHRLNYSGGWVSFNNINICQELDYEIIDDNFEYSDVKFPTDNYLLKLFGFKM